MNRISSLAIAIAVARVVVKSVHAYDIKIVNNCPDDSGPIYAAASQHTFSTTDGLAHPPLAQQFTGSGPMKTGDSFTISPPDQWVGGRVWARQGCTGSGATMTCKVGACPGGQYCTDYPSNWQAPLTLAEIGWDYNRPQLNDMSINLSIVTGFTIPMGVTGTGMEPHLCDSATCDPSQAYNQPNDNQAMANAFGPLTGNYVITFCPNGSLNTSPSTRFVRKKREITAASS